MTAIAVDAELDAAGLRCPLPILKTRKALARLPARERVVVGMCLIDGKSQREACEALRLSKGYVSKLLARGLAKLEEALRD